MTGAVCEMMMSFDVTKSPAVLTDGRFWPLHIVLSLLSSREHVVSLDEDLIAKSPL